MDKIKLGFAFLLMAAGIGGFYYLRDSAMVVRVISVLAGFILAGSRVVHLSRQAVLCIQ